MACPDSETLARYAEASLDAAASDEVRRHVDGCGSCRELLITLVRSSQASPGAANEGPWDVPLPGSMLGRYRVVGTRGAGGMGVVLAAYDPQLDRQIALKVLRPDLDTEPPEKGRLRLVREAQLMARVRHPNVVTVHDVVLDGDRVFIAMELVEGKTLRDWLEATPRAPAEILRVFVAAGRGLEAAHQAGVVHRDFKPDNVLVDAQGQVLVSDFGLAWSQVRPPGTRADEEGKRIGTPAYMAPEQLKGEPVDARADQFSFCVALFEALQGTRPFEGDTTATLLRSIAEGRVRKSTGSPRVMRVLRRGLSADPGARFASMSSLLDALEQRRRLALPLGFAAVAITLLACGLWWSQRQAACSPVRSRLAASWPTERRLAFVTRVGHPEFAERIDTVLHAIEPEWERVCAAGGDDAARLRACLESRVQGLELTTEVLSSEQSDLRASTALVARLEGPESCLAGEVLTLVPAPADQAAQIRVACAHALTADALRHAGKLDEALATATTAIDEATKIGWRPVEADARLAAAQVLRARGKFKDAESMLGEALLAAEAGRHFEAIARISVQHILVVGTQTVRPDEAEPWVKRAEAALEQLPRPRLRAEVDVAITMLRVSQGRRDDALAVSERALAWTTVNDPIATADLHSLRALLFLQFGAFSRALPEAQLAASQRTSLLGAEHPLTLHAVLTLGEAQARAGQWNEALATLTPGLAAVRARKDLSRVALAGGLIGLGIALGELNRHEEALEATSEARRLVLELVGPTHRYAALAERAWGLRLVSAGRVDEGLEALRRAVAIGSEAVGANHFETLESRAELALALVRAGDASGPAEARAVVEAVKSDRSPLVAAWFALSLVPGADVEAKRQALSVAREVRGEGSPEVRRLQQP